MDIRVYSTIIIIISASIIVILERLFPYQKNQKFLRTGFLNDFLFYTLIQSYLLGLIIFSFLNYIYDNYDLKNYRLFENIPVLLQVIIFVITHDFYIYWFHRWQHNNKYLWRTHEAHHSPREVDWLSGSRSHSIEILINQTVEFAPIILLGAAPEVAVFKGMISAIWGMYIHSNINVRMGKLQYFINGPEMHRWHHSDDGGREFQNNYSTKLAIWDWIFGTAFYPDPRVRKPKFYGLRDTPDYPIEYSKKINFDKNKLKSFKAIYLIPYYFSLYLFYNLEEYLYQHLYAFRRFQ